MSELSNQDLVRELCSASLLNRVRQLLSQSAGRIDQACRQRRPPSPVDIRRMEFEDAQKIIDLVRSEAQIGGTPHFESADPRIPEQNPNRRRQAMIDNPLSHEIRWHPGFDCVRFECAHGSKRCYPGSGGSHGVHGLGIEFISLGPLGAVSFHVFTGWLPEQDRFASSHGPQAASVTVHRPIEREVYTGGADCDILPGGKCSSDDHWFSAVPEQAFHSLVNGGIDKLWEFLDGLYHYSFSGGQFPTKYEYPFPLRVRQ